MASVIAMLRCIGIEPGTQVSTLFDLFGFARARVPADAGASVTAEVSLLQHARDLGGRHVHLNVVRVGWDTLTVTEQEDVTERLDYAIYRARKIYRPAGLGVGRVEHFSIAAADANGRDAPATTGEALAVIDEWTIPNAGINVYIARETTSDRFIGVTPASDEANCEGFEEGRGGTVGAILITPDGFRVDEGIARTFSHEIGHFLTLDHNHGEDPDCPADVAERDNLMAQTRCAAPGGLASDLRRSVLLTAAQSSAVRGHCSKQNGCAL